MICIKCNEETRHYMSSQEGIICHHCECKEKEDAICCKECGKYDSPSAWGDENDRQEMFAENICFGCQYWYEKIRIKDEDDIAIIGGQFFSFDPPNEFWPKRGTIHKGGKVYDYGFLGNGSKIPLHFRGRLPNNATFGKI